MDSAEFHAAVYDTVRLIPERRVTTYGTSPQNYTAYSRTDCTFTDVGHIAKLIGMPNYSRLVGQALKFLSPETNPPVPWHRVINSAGTISSRGPGTDGAQRQREVLEAEGVEVTTGRTGESRIDLGRWGWFPRADEIEQHVADSESEDEA